MRLAGKARPTQPSQGKASQAAEPNQPAQKSAFGLPGGSANKCGAPDQGASGVFFSRQTTTIPGKQMWILIVFVTFRLISKPKPTRWGNSIVMSAAKTSVVSAAKTSALSAAKTSALSAAKASALKTSASSHISKPPTTTSARRSRAHVVVFIIEM